MASPRLQVYLHVGPPKTGTTYIQDILWRNRQTLLEQGVTLPGTSPGQQFHAAMDLRGMRLGDYEDPRIPGTWRIVAGKAATARTPKVLISHELFAAAEREHAERVAADLDQADVHIVFTARDLGRQLPAVWQESLKNQSARTFERFLKRSFTTQRAMRRPHFFWSAQETLAVLDNWSAAAPPERIHVVTAPPSGGPPNELWRRFSTAIDIDPDAFDLSVARPNASLTRVDAEVLRMVNAALPQDLPWPEYHRLVKRRFNNLANQQVKGSRARIPDAYRDQIEAQTRKVQRGITDAGYDVIGSLDDLSVPVDAFGPDEALSSDEVAAAATRLLASVLMNPTLRGREALAAHAELPEPRRKDRYRDLYYGAIGRTRKLLRR